MPPLHHYQLPTYQLTPLTPMAKPLPKPIPHHRYKVEVEVTHIGSVILTAPTKEAARKMADKIVNADPMPEWAECGSSKVSAVIKQPDPPRAMCENCDKYPIAVKDYRTSDMGTSLSKYSCEYCFNLNNEWNDQVRIYHLDPKEILTGKQAYGINPT